MNSRWSWWKIDFLFYFAKNDLFIYIKNERLLWVVQLHLVVRQAITGCLPSQISFMIQVVVESWLNYYLFLILFKQSLSSGVIDPSLKRAAIVPVLSRVIETAPSNYRPISLTSVIIKVLDIIIRKQIVVFLISKGYLNPTQHGIREGRSCLSALLNV